MTFCINLRKTFALTLLATLTFASLTPGASRAAGAAPAVRDSVNSPAPAVKGGALVPEIEPGVTAPSDTSEAALLNQPAIEDIPLQMNADVLKWIQFFTGNGRSTFERWLKRSGRYMDLFRTVLQKEGLPPDLVHLVFVESGFNMNARSYAAAVGPWQFLQSSGKLFGLNVDKWVDERKDPEKSTVAAARYLKHLYGIFGDWPLALASYNAGEGTVLRAIKAQGTTNYWDLKLPRQTEEYVPQFMAALAITRDPVKYGFSDVEMDDPLRFDEISMRGAVDLRAIAKLADCSFEDLKALNPAVRSIAVKGNDGFTTIRVPLGKSEVIQQKLSKGSQLPAVDLTVRHRVQRGETLRTIAAEYSVSAKQIAAANDISRHHPLRRGMLLTVPASMRAPAPEVIDRTQDPRASTAYVPARKIGLPAKLNGNSDAADRKHVTVAKGQTLWMISQSAGVSVDEIREGNHLTSDALTPGQRLRIHTGDDAATVAATAASDSAQIANLKAPSGRKHGKQSAHGRAGHASSGGASANSVRVRKGDTLGAIAARHGVSVQELRRANHLRGNNVRPGQKLRLPG
jgi:membrane-bound lytic murein transglycosylase D